MVLLRCIRPSADEEKGLIASGWGQGSFGSSD